MTDNLKTSKGKTRPAAPEEGFWRRAARSPLCLSLLLALVTVAVYLPAAQNGFVNYDDSDYVTVNPHVQGGLTRENVVWAFTKGHSSNWHPLTWLSHMLDREMFGETGRGWHFLNQLFGVVDTDEAAPGPHLVNVLFHVVNTVLLFLVLRELTGAMWRSAMVAALFALHPLHVESVAWISERKDVLSTMFFLLTLWAYARYGRLEAACGAQNEPVVGNPATQRPTSGSKGATRKDKATKASPAPGHVAAAPVSRGLTHYILALVFFASGLMSKPMLVTVPFVLLLVDYWPLQRVGFGNLRCWGRLAIEKIPYFILVAGSCVVTFIVQRKGGAVSTSLTLGARVANAVVSYMRYIRKLFWPGDLSVLYPHPGHWPVWPVAICTVLLVAMTIAALWFGRGHRYLLVGWLWYLGTLVPVIGFVQVGIQSMADRYTYIPAIGLFIIIVWGVSDLAMTAAGEGAGWRPWPEGALAAVAAVVLALCAWLTVKQVQIWRNSETLFRHAIEATPRNYLAYNNLGYFLGGKGKTAEAMEYYEASLRINPTYEDALNNLGYGYANQKKYAAAIEKYEAALRTRPRHPEVHNNLGNALAEMGRVDEAISHYKITLEQVPEHADAHNNLGIALAMKGKIEEAIPQFHLAIRYKPGNASAHSNLGNALAAQHKLDEAQKEYQETLRLKPDDARAHNNLGNVFAETGRVEEAIKEYREALRLNADNPEAHFNLGLALVRVNSREEAITHFQEALRLKPDYPQIREQLQKLGAGAAK